jgi:phospholipase D1/2
VWDVFLLDADFKIKRPTRYYRQGLSLLHGDSTRGSSVAKPDPTGSSAVRRSGDSAYVERKSLLGSIRSRVSQILHPRHEASHTGPSSTEGDEREQHVRSDTDADSLDLDSRPPTPILDPSTNTDPLNDDAANGRPPHEEGARKKKKRRTSGEVSKHTFYIENSQMRLKLFARSEVCVSFVPAQPAVAPSYGRGAQRLWVDLYSVKCYNGLQGSKRWRRCRILLGPIASTVLRRSG